MIHASSKRSVRSIIFFRACPRNATLQEDLCQLPLGMLIRNIAWDLPEPILWKVSDRSGGLLVEWTPFYSTMATAAATVIGLLFVAVQLSAERIAGDQSDRWWAIAFSTFYMFLTVFFLPLSYLSPALKPHGRAVLTLILAAIYVFRMAQTSFLIWHGMFRKRGDRLWETFWNLLGPVFVYILLGYDASRTLLTKPYVPMDDSIAVLLTVLFAIALRNSWHLVVEGVFRKNT